MANQRVRMVTPIGIAQYPYLTSPDTKFNPDGEYRVNLILDPSDPGVQEFLEKLEELAEEAVEAEREKLRSAAKNPKLGEKAASQVQPQEPYSEELDSEGEPTGRFIVKFKSKAKVKRKDGSEFSIAPKLFDAQGKPWNLEETVMGGARIRVNFTPRGYYVAGTKAAGISLQLNAVQIIENSNGGDASFFGFAAVETKGDEDSNEELFDSGEELPEGAEDF